ncbi:MAG: EAL domain-containing protein [Peptostreptococcaceae bacterium]|nr:EAL domain-containing protein [Peptostreptococcaceae bacterium]MDU4936007.1 EAL domain-containing protein [Peptostreptococcaceae bacterium]
MTENFAIENQKQISDNLNIINKAGMDIYLDDFGRGYSALSYLEKLPIRGVKIDKKFVDYICQNDKIIKMIFTLAQSLNLKVVAEGVENGEQKEIIQQMGECVIQGYLYSKPLSVKELEDKYL